MFIQTEPTPNPLTLKFLPGRVVMEEGTAFFQTKENIADSPLAKRMFSVESVSSVFFGSDFITITKEENIDWNELKPALLAAIEDHYNSGDLVLAKQGGSKKEDSFKANEMDSDIVKQIKELLDTRVKPAVAMDGGDIVYEDFKDGIVYLQMQGSCSGCPSSTATLKSGIENMLKHYVPEVKEVRASNE